MLGPRPLPDHASSSDPVPRDEAETGAPGGPPDEPLPPDGGRSAPEPQGFLPKPRAQLGSLGSRRTSIVAIDLDRVEKALAEAEVVELEARRKLDWESAKLRLRLRDRDAARGWARSSDDVEADVTVAANEGPLKVFYDAWVAAKAVRIGLRSEWRTLERAHRREVYGTL